MLDNYRHEAFPYTGPDNFVSSCVSLVRDGLDRGERLLLLLSGAKVDDVRDSLGSDADEVTFIATDEHGRNPSRFTTMLHSFQATGDGRRSLGVNESVYLGRTPAAQREAQLAESILNAPSLQSWPMSVLCLYDMTGLDEPTLAGMRRSHPVIHGQDGNPDYDPHLAGTLYAEELEAPATANELAVGIADLMLMRRFVAAEAARSGVAEDRADDLVLAANEVVTNSLRHGGGRCTVAVWLEDDAVVCEVRDRGHITDPLLGRLSPSPAATSGRGLWLANHLCDLVQIRSSEAGTVVRLFVDR